MSVVSGTAPASNLIIEAKSNGVMSIDPVVAAQVEIESKV